MNFCTAKEHLRQNVEKYTIYRKLVETFHVVSECNTAVFSLDVKYSACPTSTAVLTVGHF